MILLAIDPGPAESAWVLYDTDTQLPFAWAKQSNGDVRALVAECDADQFAIEVIASYGMAVGGEVFDTCIVIGRLIERWCLRAAGGPMRTVYRRECKVHLCGSARAKDANVRQALIDRYGGKEKAVGRKANPGPLYGISGDVWAALAVAITAAETKSS